MEVNPLARRERKGGETYTRTQTYTSTHLQKSTLVHKWYLEVLVATPVARRERRWSMEFEESGREIVGIKLLSLLYLRSTFETLTLRKCLKTVEMIKYPVSKLEMRGECIASRNLKMFFFKLLSFYFVFVIVIVIVFCYC